MTPPVQKIISNFFLFLLIGTLTFGIFFQKTEAASSTISFTDRSIVNSDPKAFNLNQNYVGRKAWVPSYGSQGMQLSFTYVGTDLSLSYNSSSPSGLEITVDGVTSIPTLVNNNVWSSLPLLSGATNSSHTISIKWLNSGVVVEDAAFLANGSVGVAIPVSVPVSIQLPQPVVTTPEVTTTTITTTTLTPTPQLAVPSLSVCVSLQNNLVPGDLSDKVAILQTFLKSQGYFQLEVNATYGPNTILAVQKFQVANGIVFSGSPSTTGFGSVGPKTLQKINEFMCNGSGGGVTPAAPVTTVPVVTPVTPVTPVANVCAPFNFPQNIGSTDATTGGQVTQLQNLLQKLGYFTNNPNGYFDALTQSAVKAFQYKNNIISSSVQVIGWSTGLGVVGPQTRAALQAACALNLSTQTQSQTTTTVVNATTSETSNGSVLPPVVHHRSNRSGGSSSNASVKISEPSLTTQPATDITATSATLNGTITSIHNGTSTLRGFNYGLTESYGFVASSTGIFGVGPYSQSVSGLTPNTLYHYQAFAVNEAGSDVSNDRTFTTLSIPDTTAPIISAVASSTTNVTATISWTTNELASSVVEYGSTTSYNQTSLSNTLSTSHIVTLTGLTSSSLYHFRVGGSDASGNISTSSDATFTTLFSPDVTVPTISLTAPSSGTISGSSVTVSANASDNIAVAGVKFYYGTTLIGSEDTASPYSVTWDTTLISNGSYILKAVARDTSGNVATSSTVSVNVNNTVSDVTAPTISSVASTTDEYSATITWTTNEPSTSRVDYGLTTSYGSQTSLDSSLVTNHSQTITGLPDSTLYHFRVRSADSSSNSTTSSDYTFTTAIPQVGGAGPDAAPSNLNAVSPDSDTINLSWTNNATNQTGFRIERSLDEGTTFTTLANVGANTTSYADNNLTPEKKYVYRVRATTSGGSSAATYPLKANVLANFVDTGHPQPTRTSYFVYNGPNVTLDSTRPGNIFYPDEAPFFFLNVSDPSAYGLVTSYEVRDYYGNLVDSGNSTDLRSLTVAAQPPGFYKLYVFNPAVTSAQFGDTIGGTTFTVVRRDANFPNVDDMLVDQGFVRGNRYIKSFSRVDPTINFDWQYGPNPIDNTTNDIKYAVVWTGQIKATTTDTYTLSFSDRNASNQIRMTLDGKAVINRIFRYSDQTNYAVTTNLQAGHRYDIRIETIHNGGGQGDPVNFRWNTNTMATTTVPQDALYPTATSSTASGLTGTYYRLLEPANGLNDQTIRAITAMGPQRYAVLSSTTPEQLAEATSTLSQQIAVDEALYVGKDPQRPRPLMIAFPDADGSQRKLDVIAEVVREFKDRVKYYEPRNEPNDGYSEHAINFVNNELIPFYNTVHGIDSSLKVLGPGYVTLDGGAYLYDQFFQAGGAPYIDSLSFHGYNNYNGDFLLAQTSIGPLKSLMNAYGIPNKEIWMTEQGNFTSEYGGYFPRHEGQWTMSQLMSEEQQGIPKERNHLWYDISHGFQEQPAWWENDNGSLNPEVGLINTWSQELFGTNYVSAYDFGSSTTKVYLGSYFSGPGKNLAVFMSNGAIDGKVTLNVSGGSSLRVVDAWGNAQNVPVSGGMAVLKVPELPIYVELASGQTISVVKDMWGTDLALTSNGASAQASGDPHYPACDFNGNYCNANANTPNSPNKVIDGVFQNWYYNFNDNVDHPWVGNNASGTPSILEIDLATTTAVGRVMVYAPKPWQQQGAPEDYYLQYYDATTSAWVNIEHVQEASKTIGIYSPFTSSTADDFYSTRSVFLHTFPQVQTSKIRIYSTQQSWGQSGNQIGFEASHSYYISQPPQLTLQEVEIYAQ